LFKALLAKNKNVILGSTILLKLSLPLL
jgi:hypothetical protein